jgi:hypothetical protein
MKFTNSLRTSLYTTVGALLLTLSSFAQAPEKMSYQAVIRVANNALVTNQQVGMQISILQGSTAVYEETQTPTSNTNGLVSLEIGTGTVISGSFTAIDWSADTYFIKTETDPTGGTNYTITGTSQLLSVPFALYATTSGDGITTDQSDAIVLNTAKVGVTSAQANEIVANTTKVGITAVQASAITANTAKVGYTEAAVSANTDVAANTAKVGYTEAAVSANTDVAANTAKVGYTEAAVSANTDVAANTAKVGYTEAAVSANTDVAANTAKVGYTEAAVSANTDVAVNTAKVGYTEAAVSANTDVAANTAKVGYTEAAVSANTDVAANTAKVGYTEAAVSSNTDVAANTAKVGYTEAAVSANTDVAANTAKVGYTETAVSANTDVAANIAKVGYTDELVSANTDVAANTAKVGYTDELVSANTDVAANTAKVGYTEAAVSANTDVAANTLKVGITAQQASDITSNNAKTGITSDQADAIIANTSGIATNMTNAQRQAISNPAAGLQVFVTDFDGGSFMFYDGTKWGTLSFTKTIPDAPTIGTATLGNAQATVPFTAPSSDGGSAITSYTATSSPGAITGTISQSGSGSIIVTGLTNSTAYTFTVTATNVFGTSLASGASNSVTPQVAVVGDFYGGGVVFYIFGSGDTGYIAGETHGLIAAVQDQSSGIRWYNGSNTTTGATATTIGTGSANTDAIIAAQGATETSYAAGLARAYTGGGYTDWFLPSKDELNKMYLNRATINTTAASNSGSDFGNSYYWSSTEVDGDYAWSHSFTSGVQYSLIKNYTFYVRAVRAF